MFESSGSPALYSVGNITLVEESTNMVMILNVYSCHRIVNQSDTVRRFGYY